MTSGVNADIKYNLMSAFFFDIAKNYVDVKPIYIVGLIDLNYIECYHNTITIPVKVLFDFYLYI